jgi:hypothetical protein
MMVDGYEFNEGKRPDGTSYLTCTALPGFHLIVSADENAEEVVRPILVQFLELRAKAMRNHAAERTAIE